MMFVFLSQPNFRQGVISKIALVFLLIFLSTTAFCGEWFFPPLFTFERDVPVTGEELHVDAIGPIVEYSESDNGIHKVMAVRPLWSMEEYDSYSAVDVVWPVAVWRDSWFMNFCWVTLFYTSTNKTNGFSRYYFIPVWFSGRNDKSDFFWGFFPLYGDVYDLIGYDRIRFILFPLFWETKKGETEGQGYLWPMVNWDSGPRIDKFRIFPFYAYNHSFGRFYSQTYMWPFIHKVESMNPDVPGSGWMFWPFVGHNSWKDESSWSFIWPFFQKSVKGEDGFALNAPWPFFQYRKNMSSKEEYMLWLFPFWGHTETLDKTHYSVLWPFGSYLEDRGEDKRIEWLWVLPFYWTKSSWSVDSGKRSELYRRFWPFASYYEDSDVVDLKVLDLWPQRNMRVIERNWDPLWQLFRYKESSQGFSWSMLWGILKCRDTESDGDLFSFFPFCRVEYNLCESESGVEHSVSPAIEESCEPAESLAESKGSPSVIRDFLGGIVRFTVDNDDKYTLRLFWFLEF